MTIILDTSFQIKYYSRLNCYNYGRDEKRYRVLIIKKEVRYAQTYAAVLYVSEYDLYSIIVQYSGTSDVMTCDKHTDKISRHHPVAIHSV